MSRPTTLADVLLGTMFTSYIHKCHIDIAEIALTSSRTRVFQSNLRKSGQTSKDFRKKPIGTPFVIC